jgi:hypothetical protein
LRGREGEREKTRYRKGGIRRSRRGKRQRERGRERKEIYKI